MKKRISCIFTDDLFFFPLLFSHVEVIQPFEVISTAEFHHSLIRK